MRLHKTGITIFILMLVFNIIGCAGLKPTVFLHPEFNFSFVEKVAVIPFENLSKDQGAAYRTTRFFIAELLSSEAFEVIEPGEVRRIVEKIGTTRTAELTRNQIIQIGQDLKVQALFLGTINESTVQRSGSSSNPVVTMIVRMVETETGATIWSATHTQSGKSFWSSIFGGRNKSMSEITRTCVKKTVRTLIN